MGVGVLAALLASAPALANDIVIAEYQRSAANPNVADPTSKREILRIAHPTYKNHYGGQVTIGPDGMLYAATGDGGGSSDPGNNAQDTTSLLGKLLRVDPNGGDPYAIPAGNPFAAEDPCGPSGGTANCPEVYAWGLRNPYRFTFDTPTGDIWIGDVGQTDLEEIDHVTAASLAGSNFGWDCFEGTSVETAGCAPFTHTSPVFEYPNPNPGGAAVTAGYVVRDTALTPLLGRFVYGDTYTTDIRSFDPADPDGTDASTGVSFNQIVSFGLDAAGKLLLVSYLGDVSRMRCANPCDDLGDLSLEPAFTGTVNTPLSATAHSGDASRLFVAGGYGSVCVAVNGEIQPTPFLDISSIVDSAGEGGLLSVALAPDYPTSGRFYVYFVETDGTTTPQPDGCRDADDGGGGATPPPPSTDTVTADTVPPGPEPSPPPAVPAADRVAPGLVASIARRQPFLRLRRVLVRARCSERCLLRVGATTTLPGTSRTVRLRGALVRLEAGESRTVRIAIPRRIARRLTLLRRPRVRVVLRARDGAGNAAGTARTVLARR